MTSKSCLVNDPLSVTEDRVESDLPPLLRTDRYAPEAPEEFKKFLTDKEKENKQLLDFFAGEPDVSLNVLQGEETLIVCLLMTQEATRKGHYAQAEQLWKSVGILVRGVITQALQKNEGPYAAGEQPSEVDCESIPIRLVYAYDIYQST